MADPDASPPPTEKTAKQIAVHVTATLIATAVIGAAGYLLGSHPAKQANAAEPAPGTVTVTESVTVTVPAPAPSPSVSTKAVDGTTTDAAALIESTGPTSHARTYSTVTLATICATVADPNCQSSSDAVGDAIFSSSLIAQTSHTLATATPSFSFPATSCRSVTFQFAMPNADSQGYDPEQSYRSAVITATLVQGRGSKSSTTTFGHIGQLTATLDGGPWQLMLTDSDPNHDDWAMRVNGTAQCSTADGV